MKKMIIYEPAMCCPTGLCGVSVDPELLRISTLLNNLKKKGIIVERYNLTNAPGEFIKNDAVNQILSNQGMNALPIIMVDEKVVITKRYPTNEEFANLLAVDIGVIGEEKKTSKRYKVTSKRPDRSDYKGGCC